MSYHQTIYNLLRGYGLSEAGALGMLGNWECESGCEPYRVQGDYQASRAISKAYSDAVMTGQMTKSQFANDQKGYGLAQWTYPARKRNLWEFSTSAFQRIDSCELQVEFAIWELQGEYPGLLPFLKTSEAIWDCTDRICREYERPAVNNVDARYQAALSIRRELDLSGKAEANPSQSEASPSQSEVNSETRIETWPPRVIDEHCTGWPEVWLLQSLLKCHGINVLIDGIWGQALTEKVKQYQKQNGLDPDGAVGPMSWAKLFER